MVMVVMVEVAVVVAVGQPVTCASDSRFIIRLSSPERPHASTAMP